MILYLISGQERSCNTRNTLSRIATLPAGVNIAHVVKKANQQLTVPVTVSGGAVGGGAKENLYVIALPPDQLRNGLIHYWMCHY